MAFLRERHFFVEKERQKMGTDMKALEEETTREALDNMGLETQILVGLLEVIEVAAEREELTLGTSLSNAAWLAKMLVERQRYRLHKHGDTLLKNK